MTLLNKKKLLMLKNYIGNFIFKIDFKQLYFYRNKYIRIYPKGLISIRRIAQALYSGRRKIWYHTPKAFLQR